MNLLTFDIEEWYLLRKSGKGALYDRHLDEILEKLEQRGIKATFFCLGEMGNHFPEVVRKIQKLGHEVGCHSNTHLWLNKMSVEECREDTHAAVDTLEQCIGEKVKSYRAPAFSIGESNKWAFEVLAENGITRDASIFPVSRDVGGFPSFGQETPCLVDYDGVRMQEFPICTTKVLGKELAYSGGGYFRFYPLGFVERSMKKAPYSMFYFHIGDLIPEHGGVLSKKAYEAYFKEPGTIKARYMRYFKMNMGKKNALNKVLRLLNDHEFINLPQAEEQIDWQQVPVVKL